MKLRAFGGALMALGMVAGMWNFIQARSIRDNTAHRNMLIEYSNTQGNRQTELVTDDSDEYVRRAFAAYVVSMVGGTILATVTWRDRKNGLTTPPADMAACPYCQRALNHGAFFCGDCRKFVST